MYFTQTLTPYHGLLNQWRKPQRGDGYTRTLHSMTFWWAQWMKSWSELKPQLSQVQLFQLLWLVLLLLCSRIKNTLLVLVLVVIVVIIFCFYYYFCYFYYCYCCCYCTWSQNLQHRNKTRARHGGMAILHFTTEQQRHPSAPFLLRLTPNSYLNICCYLLVSGTERRN